MFATRAGTVSRPSLGDDHTSSAFVELVTAVDALIPVLPRRCLLDVPEHLADELVWSPGETDLAL